MTGAARQDVRSILDIADKHPLIQQIRKDQADELLEKRTEASRKIEGLEKESKDRLPKLQAVFEEKQDELRKIQANLRTLEQGCREAKVALANEAAKFEREIEKQRNILMSSYDSRLDDAEKIFRAKIDDLRRPNRINTTGYGAELNLVSWTKSVKAVTNRSAVLQAIAYCQSALKIIDKVKLAPSLDGEWLDGLKKGIPDCEQYTEVSGEVNMDKAPSPPSVSAYQLAQMDKELKQVNDKFTTWYTEQRLREAKSKR